MIPCTHRVLAVAFALVLALAGARAAPASIQDLLARAESEQARGRFAAAERLLEEAREEAAGLPDLRPRAAVLGALGNLHFAAGRPALAREALEEAAALAREADAPRLEASLENNLAGGLAADPASRDAGRAAYARAVAAADRADDASLAARIVANHARLEVDALGAGGTDAIARAEARVDAARARVEALLAGPDATMTRVHLAETLVRLFEARGGAERERLEDAHALLVRAGSDAAAVGDARGVAWADGTMAALYAHRDRLDEALTLCRRAVHAAQSAGATDAELRFLLRAARLLARQGNTDAAIESYRVVVARLAEIRPALASGAAAGPDGLREESSSAVRELADLLLARAASSPSDSETDLLLTQSLMERFKADELRDYFRDDCVDAFQQRVTRAQEVRGAVVLYPVILPDRLELLVNRGGRIERTTVPIGREELEAEVRTLRSLLEKRVTRQYLPHAQRVYDWLVRPVAAALEAEPDATLVFVPDGVLRLVPVAALHDGERFLVERRPVASTPSLELSDPHPIDRDHVETLLAGLSQAVQGYEPLPRVRDELAQIEAVFPADVLLDERFVESQVEDRIRAREYGVVHLASHGQVGARVEDSYILTADGRIELAELSGLLRTTRYREKPVEIITLSACDTAAGDERAALGLSGLAVRAGARSALGSLWLVNDEAASRLMVGFYSALREPGVSRARALQRAQKALIADSRWRHPGYWSPFLLISNWL